MKIRKRYLIPLLLLAAVLLGPRRSYPTFDGKVAALHIPLSELDAYISQKEAAIKNLKPDNEARIVWADSIRRTPYSIVYLHGWSASQEEGDPIHEELAKRYGANLFLSRLAGHGINSKDSFLKLTPKDLVESAKEALAIGRLIGEKTILMSCSTGGTLSIYLAAQNPELVHAQLLYSPNIDIYDNSTELLTAPWGKQISEAIMGKYHSFSPPQEALQYWTTTYRTEGLICLKSLIETTMVPAIWQKVKQPLFMGYYYKNEEEQDHTVSVADMLEFYKNVSTPEGQKRKVAFPDAGEHVVLSKIYSKDLESVRKESFAFMEEVLGLRPK
ncbi:MAG TPA: alpha/beta hydrolase [Bacteroidetes bacterium]|nr:alpha/beta hydrolase [Bacteroidota bacterium]